MTRHRFIRDPDDVELIHLRPSLRPVLYAWRSGVRSYRLLSEQLNIPLGTVKSQLNRARNALAKLRETRT